MHNETFPNLSIGSPDCSTFFKEGSNPIFSPFGILFALIGQIDLFSSECFRSLVRGDLLYTPVIFCGNKKKLLIYSKQIFCQSLNNQEVRLCSLFSDLERINR